MSLIGVTTPKERDITLIESISSQSRLRSAWSKIRENAQSSFHEQTRKLAAEFDSVADSEIRKIQRSLRNESFAFQPQIGVLKGKSSGGKRGIVVGPIPNRIVERAILECLVEKVPFVQKVIDTQTSVGGVPDRGVGHGLYLIREALSDPDAYYIRSDISNFFGNISQEVVLDILAQHIDERSLVLVQKALNVTLSNEIELGENRKVFPSGHDGVAQGSPLSALMGNILLHDFDSKFNGRGVTCIRFIDDFILIGRKNKVKQAFLNAKSYLGELGLNCHDPFESGASVAKTQRGKRIDPFTFLGYEITWNSIRPCDEARSNLIAKISDVLSRGREDIVRAHENKIPLAKGNGCYVRTLDLVRKTIFGWGNAFAFSTESSPGLDKKVDQYVERFNVWFKNYCETMPSHEKRRALGVPLLSDVKPKSLDELPRKVLISSCRRTVNRLKVSTDGSRLNDLNYSGYDRGPGGWAAVYHSGEVSYGYSEHATNNEMELLAVIKAIENSPKKNVPLEIFTDSNYVYSVCSSKSRLLVRSNIELWGRLEELSSIRQFVVSKVKAHSGDTWNEKADKLAKKSAKEKIEGKSLEEP